MPELRREGGGGMIDLKALRNVGNLHEFAVLFGFDWNDPDWDWTWHDVAVKMADDIEAWNASKEPITIISPITTVSVGGGMSDLKPCPFCGGEAVRRYHDVYMLDYVKCRKCGAQTGLCANEDEATAAWNTRAERTCRMDVFTMHDDGTITYQCSECGQGYCVDDRPPNYCPMCGAKIIWE